MKSTKGVWKGTNWIARPAPAHVSVAMLAAAFVCVGAGGCTSHEDRWGRDPAELKEKARAEDDRDVELAKGEVTDQEYATPVGQDDIGPVSVLFINGDALTVDDVLKWIRYELERMAVELTPTEYSRRLIERAETEIRAKAETQLLVQAARRYIESEEEERLEAFVDARIRDIINTEHGGRQTRYEQWLRERGITAADDRERIRRDMLIVAYLQRSVGGRVAEPTRREMMRLHELYLERLDAMETRRMLLIDIPVGPRDAVGRERREAVSLEEARLRADAALAKIHAGADFAEVAREYSEGIDAGGGDWGWVSRGGVRPRWLPALEAVYSLDEGDTSDVIETPEALFIVRCSGIDRQQPKSFEEMQAELIETYKNRQFEVLTRELVSKLYESAEFRPANPGRFLRAVIEAAPKPAPFR